MNLGQGCLLVASPELGDPSFARSVVFMLSHGPDGSFGLVLNRPLDVALDAVLEAPGDGAERIPVLRGGPVQPEMLQFLSDGGAGSVLSPGIAVGGTLDELLALARAGRPVRAYSGYSGWSGGQLERELREGSWIVAPSRAEHVFVTPATELWVRVLRELGGRYAWLALEGGDPGAN